MTGKGGEESTEAQQLVCLEAQAPLGMCQTIFYGSSGVGREGGPVHRLQRKVLERKMGETLWLSFGLHLRKYEFELLTAGEREWRAGFRADTEPVDPRGRRLRAVGLDRDFEPRRVKRVDEGCIELEQRFATRADHIGRREEKGGRRLTPFSFLAPRSSLLPRSSILVRRPQRRRARREVRGSGKLATIRTDADKIGVAEHADGVGTVRLTTSPEVAAAEPAEHSRPAGVNAFALKREEEFLD